MNRRAIPLFALAGLSAPSHAQIPSFQYAIQVPAALNAGQTAAITVLCGFTPGVGGTVTGGTVLGLSSGAFNVVANAGSWSANAGIAPYNFLPGVATSPGTIAGTNVNGVTWGNGFGPPIGTVSTVNPTPIWQATFTVPDPLPGQLKFHVNPVGPHGVWYMPPTGGIASELTSLNVQGASVLIPHINPPAPAGASLLALAMVAATRRRRTQPQAALRPSAESCGQQRLA